MECTAGGTFHRVTVNKQAAQARYPTQEIEMATQNEQKPLATTSQQQQRSSSESALSRRPVTQDLPLLAGLTPRDFFRLNPFALMRRISEEMDRAVQEVGLARDDGQSTMWAPAIEVREENGTYRIQAELPGLSPEDVQVDVSEDAVVIQGERREEHEESKNGARRTERQYGLFYRSIPLPEGAQTDQAKATFRDGVIEVTIPVPQQKNKQRSIPIEAESGTRAQQQKQAA